MVAVASALAVGGALLLLLSCAMFARSLFLSRSHSSALTVSIFAWPEEARLRLKSVSVIKSKGDTIMKKAFYSLALGAALLLTGSVGAARGRVVQRSGIARSISSPCAQASSPAEGHILACLQSSRTGELSVGCSTSLSKAAWIFAQCACGHSAILPQGHVRQHCRLYETASRRDQRPLQVSIGVHGLSRRRR